MSTVTWNKPWSFILDRYHHHCRTILDGDVLNLVYLVRSFYLVCIIAIVTARLLSPLRQRFLAYGARTQHKTHETLDRFEDQNIGRSSYRILDILASVDVPHSWFTHFYIVSTASSCLWMWLLFLSSDALLLVDRHNSVQRPRQPVQSALICVILMSIQSVRRFLECVTLFKTSNSRMWIGHYAFGLAFYLVTNVAVWIESMDSGLTRQDASSMKISFAFSVQTCIGLAGFVLASLVQLRAHSYLAKLKRYTLPTQGLFPWLVAPHYTAECSIYLSLALLGAPKHRMFNRTLLCTTLLTAVNLGMTAEGTKQWMLDKFREQHREIENRWLLVPGIW